MSKSIVQTKSTEHFFLSAYETLGLVKTTMFIVNNVLQYKKRFNQIKDGYVWVRFVYNAIQDQEIIFHSIDGIEKTYNGKCVCIYEKAVCYVVDGKIHRENEPAMIHVTGTKEYYNNGKRHRVTGPAVVFFDGAEHYYIDGKSLTYEEYWKHPKVIPFRLKNILEHEDE